jgi:hypothetical protein
VTINNFKTKSIKLVFAKIIHMNLAVKFNLLKNTQPHYSYTPESCLENDSYKLYFDRTILTDIHIKHNRPDIIILNKQQKASISFRYSCSKFT